MLNTFEYIFYQGYTQTLRGVESIIYIYKGFLFKNWKKWGQEETMVETR